MNFSLLEMMIIVNSGNNIYFSHELYTDISQKERKRLILLKDI